MHYDLDFHTCDILLHLTHDAFCILHPTMRQMAPTVLDVTHSLQQPNQSAGVTGGRPEMIETIARAGVVNNVDGLFIETHFDPANAKSDGANMLHLDQLEGLLERLVAVRTVIKSF